MNRYAIDRTFSAHLGPCSCIADGLTGRRIVIAGDNHEERARRRLAQLEAAEKGCSVSVRGPVVFVVPRSTSPEDSIARVRRMFALLRLSQSTESAPPPPSAR